VVASPVASDPAPEVMMVTSEPPTEVTVAPIPVPRETAPEVISEKTEAAPPVAWVKTETAPPVTSDKTELTVMVSVGDLRLNRNVPTCLISRRSRSVKLPLRPCSTGRHAEQRRDRWHE
jgi:hypothetical protein